MVSIATRMYISIYTVWHVNAIALCRSIVFSSRLKWPSDPRNLGTQNTAYSRKFPAAQPAPPVPFSHQPPDPHSQPIESTRTPHSTNQMPTPNQRHQTTAQFREALPHLRLSIEGASQLRPQAPCHVQRVFRRRQQIIYVLEKAFFKRANINRPRYYRQKKKK